MSAGSLTLPLKGGHPNNHGQLIVHVEELSASRDEVTLQLKGWSLNRNDWCGWSVSKTSILVSAQFPVIMLIVLMNCLKVVLILSEHERVSRIREGD